MSLTPSAAPWVSDEPSDEPHDEPHDEPRGGAPPLLPRLPARSRWREGAGDAEYPRRLPEVLPQVTAFRPQAIFQQSGVDALAGDRLGRLAPTVDGPEAAGPAGAGDVARHFAGDYLSACNLSESDNVIEGVRSFYALVRRRDPDFRGPDRRALSSGRPPFFFAPAA